MSNKDKIKNLPEFSRPREKIKEVSLKIYKEIKEESF